MSSTVGGLENHIRQECLQCHTKWGCLGNQVQWKCLNFTCSLYCPSCHARRVCLECHARWYVSRATCGVCLESDTLEIFKSVNSVSSVTLGENVLSVVHSVSLVSCFASNQSVFKISSCSFPSFIGFFFEQEQMQMGFLFVKSSPSHVLKLCYSFHSSMAHRK